MNEPDSTSKKRRGRRKQSHSFSDCYSLSPTTPESKKLIAASTESNDNKENRNDEIFNYIQSNINEYKNVSDEYITGLVDENTLLIDSNKSSNNAIAELQKTVDDLREKENFYKVFIS
jgi:hypothetical protein